MARDAAQGGGFGLSRIVSLARAAMLVAALALAASVRADAQTPFQAPAKAKPKIVRLLAYPEYFDRRALEEFAKLTGYEVAYDFYTLALEVPDRWKEGPYDLVVLPGPQLARRIAAGALAKIDKARLANAAAVQSAVTAKFAVYDPSGAYGIPFGWSPFGLLYNTVTAPPRLGGAPSSWSALLDLRLVRKLSECGVALPHARDGVFVAAWRIYGVDPLRANYKDLKNASALIGYVKQGMRGVGIADTVGELARGVLCLSAGSPGEAEAANARAKQAGLSPSVAFAYAREGGAVAIDAFAIPRDAPHPEIAYQLLDFLLKPANAAADAREAGVVSSEDANQIDRLKLLWPEGAFDDHFAAAMETEWTHLRAAK